jgi:hypothetical protein
MATGIRRGKILARGFVAGPLVNLVEMRNEMQLELEMVFVCDVPVSPDYPEDQGSHMIAVAVA